MKNNVANDWDDDYFEIKKGPLSWPFAFLGRKISIIGP